MRKFLYIILSLLLVVSCSKQKVVDVADDTDVAISKTNKLVSATMIKSVSMADALNDAISESKKRTGDNGLIDYEKVDFVDIIVANWGSMFQDINLDSLLRTSELQLVTYRIKYNSVTRDKNGYKPAILTGDVSYMVDKSGLLTDREFESVSIFQACYNSSAADVSTYETMVAPFRAVYNALFVYPNYQGGQAYDGYPVLTNEFKLKAMQAIDCELAALEFVEGTEHISMMENYYTENMGVSNGGGVALALQYLLENDSQYSQYSDIIKLRSSFVGEGNCVGRAVFPNLLLNLEGGLLDMKDLAPSAYLSIVAGSYLTWEDKYFEGSSLNNFFSQEFLQSKDINGKNRLEKFLENDGYYSMMYEGFNSETYAGLFWDEFKIVPITNIINPDLLIYNEADTCYYFDEDNELIQNLYSAFDENKDITCDWSPKAPLLIGHSVDDDFLPFEATYGIYSSLKNKGGNVSLTKVYYLDHLTASFYYIIHNLWLKKHPAE